MEKEYPKEDAELNVVPTPTGQHVDLPPNQSLTSVVLNGIGNGATVFGIPLMAHEARHAFQHTELPNKYLAGHLALIATGGAIGSYFGFGEAKQIKQYRQSLNDEINKLHDETAANNNKIDALIKAVQARESAQNPEAGR